MVPIAQSSSTMRCSKSARNSYNLACLSSFFVRWRIIDSYPVGTARHFRIWSATSTGVRPPARISVLKAGSREDFRQTSTCAVRHAYASLSSVSDAMRSIRTIPRGGKPKIRQIRIDAAKSRDDGVEEVPPPHRHRYHQRPCGHLPQQTHASDDQGPPEGVVLEIFGLPEGTENSVEDRPEHFGVVEHRVRHLLDQHPCDACLPHAERSVDKQDHPIPPRAGLWPRVRLLRGPGRWPAALCTRHLSKVAPRPVGSGRPRRRTSGRLREGGWRASGGRAWECIYRGPRGGGTPPAWRC